MRIIVRRYAGSRSKSGSGPSRAPAVGGQARRPQPLDVLVELALGLAASWWPRRNPTSSSPTSERNAERVERLAAELEARGVGTWLDRHQIKPGERWQKAIEDAIRSGAFFVACFSQAYAGRTRTHMNEELLLAIAEVRLRPEEASWFIPIRLDECEVPDRRIGPGLGIRSFQWLDMFPDWAKSVDRLAEAMGPPRPELLAPLSVFREIDASWCPELVVIPPGTFMIGSTETERRWAIQQGAKRGWVDWEKPQHEVRIGHRFAVGRYLVTFEEYDRFVTETFRERRPDDRGWGRGRRPVINVSWYDARAYVAWLSQETGQPYRLLSEAEWEYAARAGSTTRYSWGDDPPTPEQANFSFESRGNAKTSEVGTFPPNSWGLYDMHRNVHEWVEDCWNESCEGAAPDGSAWTSGDCSRRVLRGCFWVAYPEGFRLAERIYNPSVTRLNYIGFRVARTLR